MNFDLKQAESFLTLLDESATEFCFQTFDDNQTIGHEQREHLAKVHIGTLEELAPELMRLSDQGAGVFVSVNATNGRSCRLANITRKRAVFQEADELSTPVPPLQPQIVVESSPGKFHRYWLIDEDTQPNRDEWKGVMTRMVRDWGSDRNAMNLNRVLRVPGFPHQKDPNNRHMVRVVESSNAQPYKWSEITDVIPPLVIEQPDYRNTPGKGIDQPLRLLSALGGLDPDTAYIDWLTVGMALHHATDGGGEGFDIWDNWSAKGGLYQVGECADKWAGFGRYSSRPVTLGSIFARAKEAGWNWSIVRRQLVAKAKAIIEATIEAAKNDPTAHLNSASIEAFQILLDEEPLAYEQLRVRLKKANKDIRIGALDDLVGSLQDGKVSLSTQLATLAENQCTLWHDLDGKAYASFERSSNLEHWAIESSAFRDWLSWLAHSELGAAPSGDVLKSVQNALSGKAKFDGEQHSTALRVAKDDSGYWIDLGDEAWRAVHITATGWRIVDRPSIRFRRNKAMRALPIPTSGGHIEQLWDLVNVPVEDQLFVLAWLLESLRAGTPFPVLELVGEQGSAKSTTQRVLRTFIDPNKAMLRPAPKTREDIFVAAGNNHLISLENLSGLNAEYSDALCTIATGGGMAGRQFFTNDEENIVEAHNPVIMNGIGAVITRADLLDRAIVICPPVIEQRMTEAEHDLLLTEQAPAIMGALLDLFAKTLAELPNVKISRNKLPRMADFAYLGEAMHRAMGGAEGEFLERYISHRREATRRTIDASPVAAACIKFIDEGNSFSGTVRNFLLTLPQPGIEKTDYWPRSPKGMGDSFRRVCPALRQLGIDASIDAKARRDGVHCTLKRGTYEITPVFIPPEHLYPEWFRKKQSPPAFGGGTA